MTEYRIDIESESLGVPENDWRDRLEVFIEHLEADPRALGAIAAGSAGHLGAVFLVEADSVAIAMVDGELLFSAALKAAAGDLGVATMRLEVEPDDYEPLQLVGASDAARLLGVSRQRFYQLIDTYEDFPVPISTPARGAVWDQRAIVAWNEKERPAGRHATVQVPTVESTVEVFAPTIVQGEAKINATASAAADAKMVENEIVRASARRTGARKRAAARKPAARKRA